MRQEQERITTSALGHYSARGLLSLEQLRTAERFKGDAGEAAKWKATGKEIYRPAAERFRRVLAAMGEVRVLAYAVAVKGRPADKWALEQGYQASAGLPLLRYALDAAARAYAGERA